MRPLLLGAMSALALLVAGRLPAQTKDSLPAFNGIRTPASPAFLLLGIAPTSVERPNTPSDLALSFLNRAAAFTGLPRDVAIEWSPYWLARHRGLKWEDDTTRTPLTSLARTATISIATAELGTEAAPVTGLAVAFRGSLSSGRLSRGTIDQLNKVAASLGAESKTIDRLIDSARAAAEAVLFLELEEARAHGDSAGVTLA